MGNQNKPAFILFGKRPRKQARAAWFAIGDVAVARWVAQRYALSGLKMTPKIHSEIGSAITEWQLGDRGNPIIPAVGPSIYTRLLALAENAAAPGGFPGEADQTDVSPPSADQQQAAKLLWRELIVGKLVLAQEDDPEDGWYEAIILARHGNTCTLCWRDHPGDGLVKRELQQLAYLYPIA